MVDHAIEHIVSMGQGALLAKIDVQSAFRLLPVHPAVVVSTSLC